MKSNSLQPHPRLYITPEAIRRLKSPVAGWQALRHAQQIVDAKAEECLASTEFPYPAETHNAHLVRARIMQGRVVTLVTRYLQTGDGRYRDAAIRHVRTIGSWEYWSWISWRKGDSRLDANFDLSYGENSATLAIAYDLLHNELSDDERRLFVTMARDRSLRPCVKHVCRRRPPIWWFGKKDTNWNTVCGGGAAMLCLAMYEELPEARRLLPLLDKSVRCFMEHLDETDGGWEEGIGYWNYGMRYAMMYLLSAERAAGRAHPMMTRAATRRTLQFPLDFCPNGVAAGFNDANGWGPLPFHLAAADRLGQRDILAAACRELEARPNPDTSWPSAAETLLLHPRRRLATGRVRRHVVEHYRGLEWSFLADRMPGPTLYASVRGGSSAVPHGQRDIMSFNLVVGDEALIVNPQSGGYLDTTFSSRREELFDMTPAAKNAILINGVGVEIKSAVETEVIRAGRLGGIRVDATAAMGKTYDGQLPKFCGRAFILLDGRALLILDRIETPHPALIETRLQTWASVKAGAAASENGGRRLSAPSSSKSLLLFRLPASGSSAMAVLTGKRQSCAVTCASSVDARLILCRPPLTWPVEPSTLLRWAATNLGHGATFATVIVPGRRPARVVLEESRRGITARVSLAGWSKSITLTSRLRAVRR